MMFIVIYIKKLTTVLRKNKFVNLQMIVVLLTEEIT